MAFSTRNRLVAGLGALSLIILWKIGSLIADSDLLIPAPEHVLLEFMRTVFSASSLPDIGSTLARGISGFVMAFIAAFVLGLVAGTYSGFNAYFLPFLVVMRATPVVAFILLLLIWFHIDWVPVIIAFITMFPIIYTNVTKGMKEVDNNLREMVKVYHVPPYERLRSVYLPSISGFLFGGIATALGFGWRAIIIGEVLSQPGSGIGTRLREAYAYFDVAQVISWTLCAVLISYGFDQLMSNIEKHSVRWKED